MFELKDKIALVTGAGQGVGADIAMRLARMGAYVVVNELHEERAHETVKMIQWDGDKAVGVSFDVSDPDAVSDGVAKIVASLGPIDILVNNAALPIGKGKTPFSEMDTKDCNQFVGVNIYGALNCTKAVIDNMAIGAGDA